MKVKLSDIERQLLLSNPETADLVSLLTRGDASEIEGSEDQIDQLREACSDVLIRVGFDGAYNANSEGVMLEALIDKLYC